MLVTSGVETWVGGPPRAECLGAGIFFLIKKLLVNFPATSK